MVTGNQSSYYGIHNKIAQHRPKLYMCCGLERRIKQLYKLKWKLYILYEIVHTIALFCFYILSYGPYEVCDLLSRVIL